MSSATLPTFTAAIERGPRVRLRTGRPERRTHLPMHGRRTACGAVELADCVTVRPSAVDPVPLCCRCVAVAWRTSVAAG